MGVQTLKIAPAHAPHDWRTQGACANRDPEIWYRKDQVALAQAYCRACPVAAECLQDALTEPECEQWTVRGGFTPGELRGFIRDGLTTVEVTQFGVGVRVA